MQMGEIKYPASFSMDLVFRVDVTGTNQFKLSAEFPINVAFGAGKLAPGSPSATPGRTLVDPIPKVAGPVGPPAPNAPPPPAPNPNTHTSAQRRE